MMTKIIRLTWSKFIATHGTALTLPHLKHLQGVVRVVRKTQIEIEKKYACNVNILLAKPVFKYCQWLK